jgi:dUTP pyrophosphatase
MLLTRFILKNEVAIQMEPVIIKFVKVSENAIIPKFAHNGDSGFDLHIVETLTLLPNERTALKTGLVCELPYNHEIQIRPRSGVSINTKLVIIFATIDSCYRGEIHIIAHNTGSLPITLTKGSSIAQGVVNVLPLIKIEETESYCLTDTTRGANGFGSTTKISLSSGQGESPALTIML